MGVRVIIVLFLAMASASARAWQGDVHYGLTLWLAKSAGFSDQASIDIAKSDAGLDQGVPDAIEDVLRSACFGHEDPYTGNQVRLHHFPSAGDVPQDPKLREVKPNSTEAWDELKSVVASKRLRGIFLVNAFGPRLHALQDSWSHQGTPGIALPCNEKLAWGHPWKRGGPYCTRADLTMYWADKDVPDTAKATYDALLLLRAQIEKNIAEDDSNSKGFLINKPRDWRILQPDLAAFATAATKAEKESWFRSHKIQDSEFLTGLSLPDGGRAFPMPQPLASSTPRSVQDSPGRRPEKEDAPPSEVRTLFERFFSALASGKDLSDIVDWKSVAYNIPVAQECRGILQPDDVQRFLRALARRIDSGSIFAATDELMCTIPPPNCGKGKAQLNAVADRAEKEDLRQFEPKELLVPFAAAEGKERRLFAIHSAGKEAFVAIASLRQTPYHSLVAEARPGPGGWRVSSIFLWTGAN